MTTIDFFVHPEFPLGSGDLHPDIFSYMKSLNAMRESSERAVLVNGYHKGRWDNLFTESLKLETMIVQRSVFKLIRGEIMPSEWQKFTRAVADGTNFRIHGAYLGAAAQAFATQLFAYLHSGEHWCNWGPSDEGNWDKQRDMMWEHVYDGDYLKSKVKYGVVMAPNFGNVEIAKPDSLFHPHGNISYQLLDSASQVYGKDRIKYSNLL